MYVYDCLAAQDERDLLSKQQVIHILRDHTKLSSVLKEENEVRTLET
jgi:hypothetical protein